MVIDQISTFEKLETNYERLTQTMTDEIAKGVRDEASVISRILRELKWHQISDSEKQERRKAKLGLAQKWASSDGIEIVLSYEKSVIDYYDLADEVLLTIPIVNMSVDLIRLEGMLRAEQYLINQHSGFDGIYHNDYYVLTGLFELLIKKKSHSELRLELLLDKFVHMYKLWKNRPYQEVQ